MILDNVAKPTNVRLIKNIHKNLNPNYRESGLHTHMILMTLCRYKAALNVNTTRIVKLLLTKFSC